jgi:phosphoglycerate dehydrogenase-like enzyme
MTVKATRRTPEENPQEDIQVFFPTWLHRLLPGADVLFVSTPLTPETEGMIGSYELSLLPDRATVVNIARGPVVDERALYDEVRTGRLQAGLDVWYNYPRSPEARRCTPPSNYPFHTLDNVVMSPHMAEHSLDTEIRHAEELSGMLNAAAGGLPIPNPVDPHRGY